MAKCGYTRIPPVEEMFASYLRHGESSSLKTPALPSGALQTTSHLNGMACVASGQAGGALHTMEVLQAYQADLLKYLNKGRCLSPKAVEELCRTTDLALYANKQTVATIGRSMAMERHLWINLVVIGKKEKYFHLDAPLLRTRLFGTSIEAAVEKFREAKAQLAASGNVFLGAPNLLLRGMIGLELRLIDKIKSLGSLSVPLLPLGVSNGSLPLRKGKWISGTCYIRGAVIFQVPRLAISDHLSPFGSSAVFPFGFNKTATASGNCSGPLS